MTPPLDYRQAGVDIDAAEQALASAREHIRSTQNERVLGRYGAFSGLFDLKGLGQDPVLVASCDGVGTKLKLAFRTGIHDTVGRDLVNHCVNDIVCCGARPLFFLDYLGTGKLESGAFEALVQGLAEACRENGMVLLGGETAEMPGLYSTGEYDLAGTIVGVVERDKIVDGSKISSGDAIIGLRSNGLHTNGYSLAQKALFEVGGYSPDDTPEGFSRTLAEELLEVHLSYGPAILQAMGRFDIRGLVHVTGGGFEGNTPRILPDSLEVEIDTKAWDIPAIFKLIQEAGSVETAEMYRVFNMGIGMLVFIPQDQAGDAIGFFEHSGFGALKIGHCRPSGGQSRVVLMY